ncbi:MAG: S8 family serine peptidase, partial [Micromonosporaceae bacterium]
TLHAVRVLNCTGSGSISGVIAGIDWVAANHQAPAVANMSLGGSFNLAMNQAVTNMTLAGVFTSVSAGASNSNACNFSPASAENVTVVAATDGSDTSAPFNNWGSCVDVFAPGMSITSTWLSGGTNTISGTSMGTAHATGAGAIYRQVFPNSTSAAVNDWVIETSTKNVVGNVPAGTPNRLLYKPPAL